MGLRDEIRDTVSPHKFGGSRHAAMLYVLSMDSGQDETTGTTEWGLHVARFGRHLLYQDDQGFVSSERCATEAEALEKFAALDLEYAEWEGE